MDPTALFTHLKIILLQCFQFSIINSIQIDPKYNTKVNKFLYQILVHFPLMEPSFALEVNKSERI